MMQLKGILIFAISCYLINHANCDSGFWEVFKCGIGAMIYGDGINDDHYLANCFASMLPSYVSEAGRECFKKAIIEAKIVDRRPIADCVDSMSPPNTPEYLRECLKKGIIEDKLDDDQFMSDCIISKTYSDAPESARKCVKKAVNERADLVTSLSNCGLNSGTGYEKANIIAVFSSVIFPLIINIFYFYKQ